VHVLKLAAIYAMSESAGLEVSPRAMERAIEAARKAEQTIFRLLPTGMSREGAAVDKLEQRIRSAGEAGLLRSELTRAFQDMRNYELESRLRTLKTAQIVFSYSRSTAGRTAEVLVHKDYLEAHSKEWPEDKAAF
jgi:hypothetical protein